MGTLLITLAILFLSLIVVIPLVEKYASKGEPKSYGNITRWLIPLMMVVLVLQLLRYMFA